jgi:hypothetical protein
VPHPDALGQSGDLFRFHPDESGGSPAASTALGAFERKPFSIPGGGVIGRHVESLRSEGGKSTAPKQLTGVAS